MNHKMYLRKKQSTMGLSGWCLVQTLNSISNSSSSGGNVGQNKTESMSSKQVKLKVKVGGE